jgi:hypothetical protein
MLPQPFTATTNSSISGYECWVSRLAEPDFTSHGSCSINVEEAILNYGGTDKDPTGINFKS